ncbi:MAG: NIPSNAP family protein [Verrucomicrobiota bacterium]
MKTTLPLLVLLITSAGCALAPGPVAATAPDMRVYELRTYTATPGNLGKVLARFRDHTVRLFAKHDIVNVGYWVPTDKKDGAGEKLVYLLAHASREAATASWAAFRADPEWVAAKAASESSGPIVAKTESVFLAATDYSPALARTRGGATRSFELRTYTVPEGKLAALDARFRDHTKALFVQHGMTNVAYFHPLDANQGAGQTLIYFLAAPSREAATSAWNAFRADPVWIAVKADSEKRDQLLPKTQSVYLTPTDFSPMQ